MPIPVVSRPAESQAVSAFLTAAASEPSGLLIEGEAGIGKTTLWLSGLQEARERGFRVMSTRPTAAESVLAYGSAADLLSDVAPTVWGDLPSPQRGALDRVLLRADGAPTDQRTVAAGFLSVVNVLADESPLLVAIDDLQWLDVSSKNVVAYVARRLTGRVGVLGCARTDHDAGHVTSWLHMPRPDAMARITVSPFKLGGLHRVVAERLGQSLPRPALVRILEISGGNPLYALELARAKNDPTAASESRLPQTLAGMVRSRIGDLDIGAQPLLLAAACVAAPTVRLVGSATDTDDERVVEMLAEAEAKGIVAIEGDRLRFAHPLLAWGVYTNATPAQRRSMHRRLADAVEAPELQARHLALAATVGDARTLRSLDAAAEIARMRGAPAAAAELLDLAIGLGGDVPERRIRSAGYHFSAGDLPRAQAMLEETIERLTPGPLRADGLSLLAAVALLDGRFSGAADLLERALGDAGDNRALRAQTLITLSFARLNAGELDESARSIDDAVKNAEGLDYSHLLSQALSMRVMVRFMRGGGLDESSIQRALNLEDREAPTPVTFRPSMLNAMLLGWTGRLDEAREQMQSIRRHCVERGEESELMFVSVHSFLVEVWRGRFADAELIADDAMDRALQLGGDLPLSVALMIRAAVAAYMGREHDARRDADEALAASRRCGSNLLAEWPITIIGFLEVSLGNYQAALSTLEPMLATLNPPPKGTEIFVATFIPDAVEALVQLGRLAEAEPLIDMLEHNGRRLDRAWMLAVSGRCRSMLLAAQGDVDAASDAARRAMVEHDRLPMPFERARTQLLVGQLHRRRREKAAASMALRKVVSTFEELGTPLWAERARAELARADVAHTGTIALTPSEQRVAELAADGMTNRDIASALFISPKSVEANLGRVYRKLGIRSRTQLGRYIAPGES